MATGTYLPLLDLVKVAVDPANVTDEDLIEVASHEHWHSLEFMQMPNEQRLLVEACPGEAAVKRFLKEHPRLAARAIVALGTVAWLDPVRVFGVTYTRCMVFGERAPKEAEHVFRRFWDWIEKEIQIFDELPPIERWRQVERRPRPEVEVPFLNDNHDVAIYGPAAERARQAAPTFKRTAKQSGDGGYWIERCHMAALREELRKAGCVARLHGPAAAFYDGTVERMSHEEYAAYIFSMWAAAREIHKPKRFAMFGAAVVTLDRLINCLHGRGFQCLEDIFERARRSSMSKRSDLKSMYQTEATPDGFVASRNGDGEN